MFTFLPSFEFILAGGPLVEATHGKLGFTATLSAITAAVVGDARLSGTARVGLPWPSLMALVRLATNPVVFQARIDLDGVVTG